MNKKDADIIPALNIHYIGSFPSEGKCPQDKLPAYAFIGRSNVGKSSLINMLAGHKAIAKVSKTPGKTQLLNYFKIDDLWYLVDLPGYGYAKVSKKMRASWEKMIERYLLMCQSLVCTFLLIDSRHTLQKNDLDFMNWLGERKIPFVIVYTKLDKLKSKAKKTNILKIQEEILKYWNEIPPQFLSSAIEKEGREEILNFIFDTNKKLTEV
jgi:GTP-binding protein